MTQARVSAAGVLEFRGRKFRAAIGRSGISADKREGDGVTPAAVLPLRRVLYRADRLPIPAATVPLEPVAPGDGWCDDPAHRDYNRMVALPHPASCEELFRADQLYDIIGVLGWNDDPPERGRGSAIFLHVATPEYSPTAGCIALALPDLLSLLREGLSAIRAEPA